MCAHVDPQYSHWCPIVLSHLHLLYFHLMARLSRQHIASYIVPFLTPITITNTPIIIIIIIIIGSDNIASTSSAQYH